MKLLLCKEWKLALHPTSLIFLTLSALLLVPNYPYYVTFFYTTLGVFFICLTGRENHDLFYTLSLPIRKRDLVKARILFVVCIELLQAVTAIPFALLRARFPVPDNQVGIEANLAFFGLSLAMLGLFNLVFFLTYYRNPDKVGSAFVRASIALFFYMLFAELGIHAVPWMKTNLDTRNPAFLPTRIAVFCAGLLLYVLLTWLTYRRAARTFEALDL